MESTTPTGQTDPGSIESASEPVWEGMETPQGRPRMTVSIHEQCSACGAGMASDQRYCVECGQRRGPARVPLLDATAQHAAQAPASDRRRRRPTMSVNSTLIAIIGTLLLAMGVGVLIGRSGNNVKSLPAQVVTVAGGGGTAGTAATTAPQSPSGAGQASKSAVASGTSAAKSAAKRRAVAPPKTVTVGSAGKGPGYQHGHFTGNFFGPEAE